MLLGIDFKKTNSCVTQGRSLDKATKELALGRNGPRAVKYSILCTINVVVAVAWP